MRRLWGRRNRSWRWLWCRGWRGGLMRRRWAGSFRWVWRWFWLWCWCWCWRWCWRRRDWRRTRLRFGCRWGRLGRTRPWFRCWWGGLRRSRLWFRRCWGRRRLGLWFRGRWGPWGGCRGWCWTTDWWPWFRGRRFSSTLGLATIYRPTHNW